MLMPSCGGRASKLMPCTGAFLKASGSEEAEKREALLAQLTQLDSHLTSNGPFLAGSALSLGDLALAPKLYATQIVCKHFKVPLCLALLRLMWTMTSDWLHLLAQ